jgi:thymidylate synthase
MKLMHTAWLERLSDLYWQLDGATDEVSPRGLRTREVIDAHLCFDSKFNLLDCPARGLNYRFAVAEWLWMAFGRSDVETLAQYNAVMRQYSDDGVFLTGAYGPHIRAQWPRIVDRLRADKFSRQAVIEIPRPRATTKDEPCTLSLQFLIRRDKLHLIVTMRSSDVWLGVPYDLFSFTQLQSMLAGELCIERGACSLNTGSSHLYASNYEQAAKILNGAAIRSLYLPNLPGRPPDWLEEVLVKRGVYGIPSDDVAWHRYARALLAPTSAGAFAALTA